MKYRAAFTLGFSLLFIAGMLSACDRQKNICPLDQEPQPTLDVEQLILAEPAAKFDLKTRSVKIGGKMTLVDRVIEGPLCNDSWSGTIYVGCDVQVVPRAEDVYFFKDCNLEIEPGTVVYVADHNDAVFYKGCSCHTAENPVDS